MENGDIWDLENTGRKDDADKPRWDLFPFGPATEVVKVLTFGAAKYGDENWQRVTNPRARYFAAAIRHLAARQTGEKKDPESGLWHTAHAICCLLFYLWFELKGKE